MSIHRSPLSWQAVQPLVTPAWICAVVGTGVANSVPGAVVVAFAAHEARRHRAQVAGLAGRAATGCASRRPTGEVGGITTILVMPAKVAPVIVGPWQPTQVVSPAWLIAEFVNLAPLTTGVAATLEPAPTWQISQAARRRHVVRRQSDDREVRRRDRERGAPSLPWHCAQLVGRARRVGVDVGQRRHHREVGAGVAVRARARSPRSGCGSRASASPSK